MKKGGKGGGNTKTGRKFEKASNLLKKIGALPGYSVKGASIYSKGKEVGVSYKRLGFYSYLKSRGVDWQKILSARLIPDEAIFIVVKKRLFVVEMKTQGGGGSVDEKLQTCDFKKKQFNRLLKPLSIPVEYFYLLDRWYDHARYRDVLKYIRDVGCDYFFNTEDLLTRMGFKT